MRRRACQVPARPTAHACAQPRHEVRAPTRGHASQRRPANADRYPRVISLSPRRLVRLGVKPRLRPISRTRAAHVAPLSHVQHDPTPPGGAQPHPTTPPSPSRDPQPPHAKDQELESGLPRAVHPPGTRAQRCPGSRRDRGEETLHPCGVQDGSSQTRDHVSDENPGGTS